MHSRQLSGTACQLDGTSILDLRPPPVNDCEPVRGKLHHGRIHGFTGKPHSEGTGARIVYEYRKDGDNVPTELTQLTKDLQIRSILVAAGGAPVWKSGAVRKGRLKGVIISTAIFIGLTATAVFVLAMLTHPLWGNYPQAPATVTGLVESHSGKSTFCSVDLRFMLNSVGHKATVLDPNPCSFLPRLNTKVTLAYNPKDLSGVLIEGYDSAIRDAASLAAINSAIVLLPTLAITVILVRSYRNARRSAGKKSWREITAVVKNINVDTVPASLLLQVPDSHGAERDVLLRYRAQDLPEFAPKPGNPVTLWLVADGEGHAIITTSARDGVSDATISTPNSFELRTLGL